ncbi:CatB-related O-acetyltransferase [Propionispora hippei]|uniref:Acetyltransferase (Isoleucine patch superfamily) n=1 Tax=Propionispora hippei DSM 15287 TaxID=1123003 RepID=A0A1M6G3U5_9FIRM|nr:CatB-related O-acetyltransferase [Propionispora hippei]SHJ04507.1 Acetyltransferase (isoleucine patch superfamily) [Propionispora hippei DSM 15287]
MFLNQNQYYQNYDIGDWTYGTPDIFSWGEGARLKIGKFCAIADGVEIMLGGEHRYDWITTYPFNVLCEKAQGFTGHPKSKGDVVIGNDVWIGRKVLILSGVTIGDGAVIGAHSVVTKHVAPYSIVAGNPAKFYRLRFKEEAVKDLLRIAWWHWPLEKIEEAWPLLLSGNIADFIQTYG